MSGTLQEKKKPIATPNSLLKIFSQSATLVILESSYEQIHDGVYETATKLWRAEFLPTYSSKGSC